MASRWCKPLRQRLKLESLQVEGIGPSVEAVGAISQLSVLTGLILCDCKLSMGALQHRPSALSHLPSLQKLYLPKCIAGTTEDERGDVSAVFEGLVRVDSLRSLVLCKVKDKNIHQEVARILNSATHLTELKYVRPGLW